MTRKEKHAIRLAVYERDNQRCVDCGKWVRFEAGW